MRGGCADVGLCALACSLQPDLAGIQPDRARCISENLSSYHCLTVQAVHRNLVICAAHTPAIIVPCKPAVKALVTGSPFVVRLLAQASHYLPSPIGVGRDFCLLVPPACCFAVHAGVSTEICGWSYVTMVRAQPSARPRRARPRPARPRRSTRPHRPVRPYSVPC